MRRSVRRDGSADGDIDLRSGGWRAAAETGWPRMEIPRLPTASISSGRRSGSAMGITSSPGRNSAGSRMRCTTASGVFNLGTPPDAARGGGELLTV